MVDFFSQSFWFTTVVKVIALFLGVFIVYLAYKGYRRNRSQPLLYVAAGFALITAGTFMEGLLYVTLGSTCTGMNCSLSLLLSAIAIGTIVIVVGFVAIIYSIYSAKG